MTSALRYKVNVPHIVHEIFEDQEAAIINLKSGNYYSLDPVGAHIWSKIESGLSVGEILEQVTSHYEGSPVEMINEVNKFIEALCSEQLILATDAAGDPPSPVVKVDRNGDTVKPAFRPPLLERYNDMQELLLLDPIHEVDDTGWPNRKQED